MCLSKKKKRLREIDEELERLRDFSCGGCSGRQDALTEKRINDLEAERDRLLGNN